MEFYKTAFKYLKHCNIRYSKAFFRSRMQSHPDYPSLVTFTDTLDEIGLAYSAVIADKEKYTELRYPVLAHCNTKGIEDFVLVSATKEFEKENHTLLQAWNGVAVMIQQGATINYLEHNIELAKERVENRTTLWAISFTVLSLLSAVACHFNLVTFMLSVFSVAGICICSQIILLSMGKANFLTEQLCSADGSQGCHKVVNSQAGALLKGGGWGDAGVIYFFGLSLFLALSSLANTTDYVFTALAVPFAFSLLLSVFSLYYQWCVVKSWCKMCLVVMSVIWLQVLTVVPVSHLLFPFKVSLLATILFLSSFIISVIGWLVIKLLVIKTDELFESKIALLKWKRTPDCFLSSLYKQRQVDVVQWQNDIILGNPNAPIQIMVACNPYCSPCAQTHKVLKELLHVYPETVSVTIRFSVNANNKADKIAIATAHILAASFIYPIAKDPEGASHVVDTWFELMELQRFKNIYPLSNGEEWIEALSKHELWCNQSKITFTPTLFINSYELPKHYSLRDLQLIIPQITENITPLAAVANVEK